MGIIESYFKESSDKDYLQIFVPVFHLVDGMTPVQKYFVFGKLSQSW